MQFQQIARDTCDCLFAGWDEQHARLEAALREKLGPRNRRRPSRRLKALSVLDRGTSLVRALIEASCRAFAVDGARDRLLRDMITSSVDVAIMTTYHPWRFRA
jgi:hypothetical protein